MKTPRIRMGEEGLRAGLAALYQAGYLGSLLLVAAGVVLQAVGMGWAAWLASAGVILLLTTPLLAAAWVGVRGAIRGDAHLAWTVLGIGLILAAGVFVNLLT